MKCPFCGSLDDKVIESRQNNSGSTIRRRRECLSCSYRFTSYERIEEVPLKVVKSDGHRQDFDLKKIEQGLWRSLEKRPVSRAVVENLLHELEDEVHLKGKSNNEIKYTICGVVHIKKHYKAPSCQNQDIFIRNNKIIFYRFVTQFKGVLRQ